MNLHTIRRRIAALTVLLGIFAHQSALSAGDDEEIYATFRKAGTLGRYVLACKLPYSKYQSAIIAYMNTFVGKAGITTKSYREGLQSNADDPKTLDCESIRARVETVTGSPSMLLLEVRDQALHDGYVAAYERAHSVTEVKAFIENYQGYDPEGLVALAKSRLVGLEAEERDQALERYRQAYSKAVSKEDFGIFIDAYRSNDPDNLVPKAQARYNALEKLEKQQEAARQAKLEVWRRGIRIGDDTFCGPVIDVRGTMVQIAIRVQLPGYASEAWLKRGELYPNWIAGCINRNGHLVPDM